MIRYPYDGEGARTFRRFAGRHDRSFLLGLFRAMLRIRIVEEEIERRYSEDQMKTPIHLVIGQEAAAVGCCAALALDDVVYSSHRTHGAYLAKGGDLREMLCELYCRANGCAGSRGGSMHLIDKRVGMAGSSAIVAGALPIATGAALAAQMQKVDRVAVVFLGDAATEEGATAESLNFAALKKLPVVFFCENNFYSVQSPLATRQPPRALHEWAKGFMLESRRVDGTNVLEVHEAMREAAARARRGEGPTFIEARVYRFRAHAGAGDDSHTGYRDPGELRAWEAVCPIESFFEHLRAEGVLDLEQRACMAAAIMTEVREAFAYAIASPEPTEDDLHARVYAD